MKNKAVSFQKKGTFTPCITPLATSSAAPAHIKLNIFSSLHADIPTGYISKLSQARLKVKVHLLLVRIKETEGCGE